MITDMHQFILLRVHENPSTGTYKLIISSYPDLLKQNANSQIENNELPAKNGMQNKGNLFPLQFTKTTKESTTIRQSILKI